MGRGTHGSGVNPSIVTERSAAVNAVETLKTDLKARAGQLEKASG